MSRSASGLAGEQAFPFPRFAKQQHLMLVLAKASTFVSDVTTDAIRKDLDEASFFLKLMTDSASTLDAVPLASPWSWFAHTQVKDLTKNTNFNDGLVLLGNFDTVQSFWCHYNNIPTPDKIFCGTKVLFLPDTFGNKGCTVVGMAIFRQGVQPAWEDARNKAGCNLCIRQKFDSEFLKSLWQDLTLLLINEELGDSAVGVRLTFRYDRRNILCHKLEIWCDDIETTFLFDVLKKQYPHLTFAVALHENATDTNCKK